jgi:PAS domain-containing protein
MAKRSQGLGRLDESMADKGAAVKRLETLPGDPSGLFTAALDHIADMVVICDAAGRHVFLNPAARALALTDAFGVELDPSVWGDWFDANDRPIPPEQWPLWLVLRGETRVEREMYRQNPDGSRFWMLLSASSIRDAGGRTVGAVATATDITARKEAEAEAHALKEEMAQRVGARTAAFEALQGELAREVRQRLDASELLERSRRMLQAILDRTAAIIYVKDTAFRYLLVNAQYERIFGITNAGVAGKTDYEIIPPETDEPLRANDERV